MRHKRKKSVRLRGSKTHGCGSMKKRRGAGNRGGRGNAGTGKKADAKKPSIWASLRGNRRREQIGFTSPTRVVHKTINVGHLSSIADALVRSGHATGKAGVVSVDLGALGYGKLLGAGRVTQKLHVSVTIAAPAAKEKIEAAGGTLEAEIADKGAVLAARKERADARKAGKKAAPKDEIPAEE